MDTIKMFFVFVFAGIQSVLGFANLNTAPVDQKSIDTAVVSPVVSPSPTAVPTIKPTLAPTPATKKTYSEYEILKIYLEYNHEQCLADQIPHDPDGTGTTQFNALVASDKKLITTYGIDKEYLVKYSISWYKSNPTYFNKIVEAGKAPCPIVSP